MNSRFEQLFGDFICVGITPVYNKWSDYLHSLEYQKDEVMKIHSEHKEEGGDPEGTSGLGPGASFSVKIVTPVQATP